MSKSGSGKFLVEAGNPFALGARGGVLRVSHRDGGLVSADAGFELDEYTYADSSHLSEVEALERYKRASADPNVFVVLEDHDCGHWGVREFTTTAAKEKFLADTFQKYLSQALKLFTTK